MDDFRMTIDTKRLEQITRQLPGGAKDLLAAAATEMGGDVVMGMQQSPASGETYMRGGRAHVASSPGNPPRPDMGELMASITHTATGELEETIHDQVEHGAMQEFGTEDIEPRPFMKPVFEEWGRSKFANLVRNFRLF